MVNQNGPFLPEARDAPQGRSRELGPAQTHPLEFLSTMRDLLEALRGSRLIARGEEQGCEILHFLLPCGRVLEVVKAKA